MSEEGFAMTCSNRRRSSGAPREERQPVKRYVHPICRPAPGGCQTLEAILASLERQNSLLEALCRTLGGRDVENL